jgi:cytochrome b
MARGLVYDLPTRLFHWLFVGLFLTAFVITKTVDEESVTFSYHMIAGMTLSFLVVLRIIWGVLGTKHAKFSGFALRPADLISYMSGIFSGSKRRWAGHNPASSWAAVIMMILALSLGMTGFRMATGPENHDIKEIHEVLATLFMLVAVTHVIGIVVHTIRHKEMIGLSMIDGKKDSPASGQTIGDQKTLIGIIGLLLVLGWGANLLAKFEPATRSLNLFGIHLQLGENEEEEHESEGHEGTSEEKDSEEQHKD